MKKLKGIVAYMCRHRARGLCALCRAEKSFTHRHLCEFTGLDFEMAIDQHYNEVLDVMDHLFVYMFNGLKHRCGAPSHITAASAPKMREGHG